MKKYIEIIHEERISIDLSSSMLLDTGNIDNPAIVEVLNIDASIAYRYSLNQDSLDIMGYWLGNIYSSENYNRLNEFSALKLGVN